MSTTYRLTLAYGGAALSGVPPQPGLRTLSSVLHDAARRALPGPMSALAFAARTDAGVHARRQIASFRLREVHASAAMVGEALAAALPADVRVVAVQVVPRSFHARASARHKAYRYRIVEGDRWGGCAWCVGRWIDVEVMRTLAARLTGERDWTALRHPRCAKKDAVRRVDRIAVRERRVGGAQFVDVDVAGPSFLRQMVRIIAGTLVLTGAGWLDVEGVMRAVQTRDRFATGPAAPAHGLTLMAVDDDVSLGRLAVLESWRAPQLARRPRCVAEAAGS